MTQAHPLALSKRNPLKFLLGFLWLALAATAFSAPVKFNIPAQPAITALQLFIKQSGVQVAYSTDDLKGVNTNAVVGEMEPAEALNLMLKDSGFVVKPRDKGWFTVVREKQSHATTGSIRGSLSKGLTPGDDIRVMIRETGQQAYTDHNGEYTFSSVTPGAYLLVATADGYQPLHITDVVVKAGYDLSLSKEELHTANGTLELQPYVVRAESVFELEKVEVTDTKPKPFSDRNVDIPRGINDVQPYYVFDSKIIDQSGATNVSDFLKQRLTMNTTAATGDQLQNTGNIQGPTNTGSINLRGLGTTETLILVNGRRMPNVAFTGSPATGTGPANNTQPDINGIPLSAIDRIEVLPSSASAIYGGSAVGGVVNIVLKKDYVGGEIKATYDITGDGHAPIRTGEISFGEALEGGKTHIFVTAQYSDSKPLYVGDRIDLLNRGYNELIKNNPRWVGGSNFASFGQYGFPSGFNLFPILGAKPNITSRTFLSGPDDSLTAVNLTLKSTGASLNSPVATLPVGYNGDPSTIIGGQWNRDLPDTNQGPNGLRFPLGNFPQNRALIASIRRQMTDNIEMFADFNYSDNRATSEHNPITGTGGTVLQASDPRNPFNQKVVVSFPINLDLPSDSRSVSAGVTVGAIVKLPHDWTSELDYTWSQNRFSQFSQSLYPSVVPNVINPFQDNLLQPPSAEAIAPYVTTSTYRGTGTVNDLAVRASGPIVSLPWGQPTMAVALEHRKEGHPNQYASFTLAPGSVQLLNDHNAENIQTNYGQSQSDDSVYLEGDVPLVKKNSVPFLYSLDLQVAGRYDHYSVGAGTQSVVTNPDLTPPRQTYTGPTLNGLPYHFKTTYGSSNDTVGLRYRPIQDVSLRASYATAFLPPFYSQLVPNPLPDQNPTTISDPKNPAAGYYPVQTISGGNPDLKPQTSKSFNAGLIWEPSQPALKGLRFNLEYYNIVQHNSITGLGAQEFLDNEAEFPGRITRDATTGLVTEVNTTLINLNEYKTSGYDLNIDYRRDTAYGTFDLYVAGTVIQSEQRQITANTPLLDYVGWTNSGGEAKYKANSTLTWNNSHWTIAWTTRYYGSYYQTNGPGDPSGAGTDLTSVYSTVLAQGGYTIPSQVYHDLFVSYAFGRAPLASTRRWGRWSNALLSNMTVQIGVKNVFNTLPPFDAYQSYAPFYYSPYGDIRLRDFWLSVRKAF